jgi:hypothetical protein
MSTAGGVEGLQNLLRAQQADHAERRAAYVGTLPEAEQQATEWKSAARSLIEAAKNRDLLVLAQIDMLKALNRHV